MDVADQEPFDDPELKAALRRALGRERAPAGLRQRLADLAKLQGSASQGAGSPAVTGTTPVVAAAPAEAADADGGRPARPVPAIGLPRPRFAFAFAPRPLSWAVAALMLIGVSLAGYLAFHRPAVASAALPAALAADMVRTHDFCCSEPDHHGSGVPAGDFAAIGRALERRLNHGVLAADLGNEHWTFHGASVCPVGSYSSAHLVFDRVAGNAGVRQHLSIFSLPASCWANQPAGTHGDADLDRHGVVAVEGQDGLYCLVGSSPDGSLTKADLRKLLDDHLPEVTHAPAVALGVAPHAAPGPDVELLHDRE